jgi:hypothetical protein
MSDLTFSGHDTFHCRQFWLKKAYDFVESGKRFADTDASLELGVGKNMVTAIRHWAKCFQMLDEEQQASDLAKKLFADNGWDPYLEDHGSLWLLHYLLVTGKQASTFDIIFNRLIKERPEFDSEYYLKYLVQREENLPSENTLKKDFMVFYHTYYANFKAKDIEESFTGILTELGLLKQIRKKVIDKDMKAKEEAVWLLERTVRNEIPLEILLYGVLKQHPKELSISFNQLYNGDGEIGSVFALSKEGLTVALEALSEKFKDDITFSNQAGIRELQFKQQLDANQILAGYYAK